MSTFWFRGLAGAVLATTLLLAGAAFGMTSDAGAGQPVPQVTSVSPNNGPGGPVIVTGQGLGFATEYYLYEGATLEQSGSCIDSSDCVQKSSNKVALDLPELPVGTVVDISIENDAGTSTLSEADQYTYNGDPLVTGVSPTAGQSGDQVTISGLAFTGATAVDFGGSAAIPFTIDSDTQITATAPDGSGVVDVTVTNSYGTSGESNADRFEYGDPPTVTGISPDNGPGDIVGVTGTGFLGVTGFSATDTLGGGFSGPCPTINCVVDSDTEITLRLPGDTPGEVIDIQITTLAGTSATTTADQYTYTDQPEVDNVSPTSGTTGSQVVITGENFTDASAVDFGSTAATVFNIDSDSQITASAPAGYGTVDVTVTDPAGTSVTSSSDQFTYPPTVTSVSPDSGTLDGGTPITITGTGFVSGAIVVIGQGSGPTASAIEATDVTVVSPTEITATTGGPAKTGAFNLFVISHGQRSAADTSDQFTYTGPTVTSVSPSSGPSTGGTPITITGTGFVSGASVVIGQGSGASSNAVAATDVTVVSPTEITATTGGPANTGRFNVFVTSDGKTSVASVGDLFAYGKPTVTSVSPSSGPSTGGTPITITGTGFVSGASVVIGQGSGASSNAVAATDVTVVSPTEITATTGGPANTGVFNVFVISDGMTSAANTGDLFGYTPSTG